MYVYLYDNFLRGKKYDSTIKAMETRLTDFGIAGKIIRLQNFTDSKAIIEDEIKKGVRGGDCIQTVHTRARQSCGTIYYESKRTNSTKMV